MEQYGLRYVRGAEVIEIRDEGEEQDPACCECQEAALNLMVLQQPCHLLGKPLRHWPIALNR